MRIWIGMTGGMAKYWIIPRGGDKELPRVGHQLASCSLFNSYVLITTKRLQNSWIRAILNSIICTCNLFKMFKLGVVIHKYYKQYRNNLTQVIRRAKANHYHQILCNFKNNTKKICRTINELKGNSCTKSNLASLQYNTIIFDNSLNISKAFNNYFSNFAPELNKLPKSNKNPNHFLKGNYINSMAIPILTA